MFPKPNRSSNRPIVTDGRFDKFLHIHKKRVIIEKGKLTMRNHFGSFSKLFLLIFICLLTVNSVSKQTSATYLDPDAPVEARVEDLMSRLTLKQKMGLRDPNAAVKNFRLRLGWSETVHGLGRHGMATVFPQAIGLGATFDQDLLERIGDAISDEVRAKYHMGDKPGHRRQAGLFCAAPVVNIVRDPRWGRAQECYGEDPMHSGLMGHAYTRGMLGDDPDHSKVVICVKHFAAHSGPERIRHSFNAKVSLKDLHETYLPAFKMVIDAGAESVMSAYNRLNGVPCVANPYLLKTILRERWGFNGYVTPDSGSIEDLWENHKVAKGPAEGIAMAVRGGNDRVRGMEVAYKAGLISEEDIDRTCADQLRPQFKLGIFDPPGSVPHSKIPLSVVGCEKHVRLAHEAAVKSVVLLKNNGVLPLNPKTHSIFVTGPMGIDQMALLGNYNGINGNLVSIAEGIVTRAGPTKRVTYEMGVPMDRPRVVEMDLSGWRSRRYDVVVAVMGHNAMLEGEEYDPILSDNLGDREKIELPDWQIDYVKNLRKQNENRPIVLIITSGSAVAVPELHDLVDAVMYAWYPGQQGGTAIAEILFGDKSPSGRLPMTVPVSTGDLPDFNDYSLKGRTYRYVEKKPLYPFGFGLSFSKFEYTDLSITPEKVSAGKSVTVKAAVKNIGDRQAEEVVQLYLTDLETSVPAPRFELKDFKRISLKPGEKTEVTFTVKPTDMELVDNDGNQSIEPGMFRVYIGGACPDDRSEELGAAKPVTGQFEVSKK